jgi:hypothetical protein
MYIVQVNAEYWLIGIWRGWLMLSRSPSRARSYQTQLAARQAVDFYRQIASENQYTICKSASKALEAL